MKRTLLAALSLSLLLGGPAFAGFGIPKVSKGGSKFNTKKVDALLKEIKDVENKYRKAKGTLYLQTESFHGIVDKYGNKKLPKLTKPWPIVDKTWTKAKNDKERGSANKLEATYSKETGSVRASTVTTATSGGGASAGACATAAVATVESVSVMQII